LNPAMTVGFLRGILSTRDAMHERIEVDPYVMLGKPIIKGTRITVELIQRELKAGMSVAEILEAHPRLRPEDIEAARAYNGPWPTPRLILDSQDG
jgi:uncharacterized protein (DUF433 family)